MKPSASGARRVSVGGLLLNNRRAGSGEISCIRARHSIAANGYRSRCKLSNSLEVAEELKMFGAGGVEARGNSEITCISQLATVADRASILSGLHSPAWSTLSAVFRNSEFSLMGKVCFTSKHPFFGAGSLLQMPLSIARRYAEEASAVFLVQVHRLDILLPIDLSHSLFGPATSSIMFPG